MKLVLLLLLTMTLSGCSSLELSNMGKTATTTTSAYLTGGIIPAVAVVGSSVIYDEVVPEADKLSEIQTTRQTIAYIADSLFAFLFKIFAVYLIVFYICRGIWNKFVNWFKRKK